jgi:hypothetical protein
VQKNCPKFDLPTSAYIFKNTVQSKQSSDRRKIAKSGYPERSQREVALPVRRNRLGGNGAWLAERALRFLVIAARSTRRAVDV